MPRSMTGYGQADENGFHFEIKGVNHRYRDIRVRLPREVSSLELQVRDLVNEHVSRGKVEVTITKIASADIKDRLSINWELARIYFNDLVKMVQDFGGEINFRDVLMLPGVMSEPLPAVDDQWPLLKAGMKKALASFLLSKSDEGKRLKSDMMSRLEILSILQEKMSRDARGMVDLYREKLKTRLAELLEGRTEMIDSNRIEQEVAVIADRSDITEELVRLQSHISSFKDIMTNPDPSIGRRLDFILQEINRELNTIGSKSQIISLTHFVIEAKSEVEKIREQAQNIE